MAVIVTQLLQRIRWGLVSLLGVDLAHGARPAYVEVKSNGSNYFPSHENGDGVTSEKLSKQRDAILCQHIGHLGTDRQL